MTISFILLCVFWDSIHVNSEIVVENRITRSEESVFDWYRNPTNLEYYEKVLNGNLSESYAKEWINKVDITLRRNSNKIMNVRYEYATNINTKNEELLQIFQNQALQRNLKLQQSLEKFQWRNFKSTKLKRLFEIASTNIQNSNDSVSERLISISNDIINIYNHAQPCYNQCLGKGEVEIVDLFKNERDYEKLQGFWIAWRNVTGRKFKRLFFERILLENMGAREHGYTDAGSFGLNNEFEESNFNETVMTLYDQILPLYKQLHGYVRYCLLKIYPGKFNANDPIPAHILGNVWAQQWNNILPIIMKCRGQTIDDNINNMVNKNLQSLSVTKMFRIVENFYKSINMFPMTKHFWERSVLEKKVDNLMDCHASAHDFSNGVDFRIKMCTEKNIIDFTTIHHEMGHIEYFMAYRDQPIIFRGSANAGFHEAIGDTIALSVKTPTHLKKIGLLSTIPTSSEFDINYLMVTALEKIAFLPFALTMDSFIWSVYNGSVPFNKLNEHWWNLRYRFQGLKPPVSRSEEDFDAGAKYHIASGISYIRYFTSFIYQFQFYEALCKLSGNSEPLHRCDFYGSKVAGRTFLQMLKKGRSQHWRDSLKILTGSRNIETKSLLTYFEPLHKWLKEINEKLNIPIGW